MKRSLSVLLTLALTLSFLIVLSEPSQDSSPASLRLVPAKWFDEKATYTLTQNLNPVTVTEEWLAQMGVPLTALSESGFGLDTDAVAAPMPDAASLLAGGRVLSVSPDGITVLMEKNGLPLLIRGDQIRSVSLDLTRCERTQQYGFTFALSLFQKMALQKTGVGRAGMIWSSDGRYVLINNATNTYRKFENIYGMTWLDSESGAMYMAQSGGKLRLGKLDERGTLLAQACVNETGNAMYCTVEERINDQAVLRLRRYVPGTASYESLSVFPGSMACEGMGFDAAGNLLFVMYEDQKELLTTCSPESGRFTQEMLPRYTSTMYLAATPDCTLLSMVTRDEAHHPLQVIWKDGKLNQLIVDDGSTVARLATLDTKKPPKSEGLTVAQASLSSDGSHALLACVDDSKAYCLYHMDTATLALTPVDMSAFADMLAEKGPGFGYENWRFLSGLCFTGGDRYVLLPFANGDTVLCEILGNTQDTKDIEETKQAQLAPVAGDVTPLDGEKSTAEWVELPTEESLMTFCLTANSDSTRFLIFALQAKTELWDIDLYLLDQNGDGRKDVFFNDSSINLDKSAQILSRRDKLQDKSILNKYKDAGSYLAHCGWGGVPTVVGVSDNYILLNLYSFGYTLIDVHTGETTLLEGYTAFLAPDDRVAICKTTDQVVIYDSGTGTYSERIMDGLEGQRINAVHLLKDGGMVCSMKESTQYITDVSGKKRLGSENYFAFYDGEGAVQQKIPLGTRGLGAELNTLYYSELTGTGIAFSKDLYVSSGIYILRAEPESARVLWLDSEDAPYAREREITEVHDGKGTALTEKPVVLCPLGISQDAQYALFYNGNNGDLLQMELSTLKMRTLLTDSDLSALFEQKAFEYHRLMTFDLLNWNGADILTGRLCPPDCVLRLSLETGKDAVMPFSIRNGVTWDSTAEEIIELEGKENINFVTIGEWNGLLVGSTNVSMFDAELAYMFRLDKLAFIEYKLKDSYEKTYSYGYLKDALTQKYGEPNLTEPDRLKAAMMAISQVPDERLLEVFNTEYWTAWDLGNGTLIMVLYANYDTGVIYFNESRITGEESKQRDTTGI